MSKYNKEELEKNLLEKLFEREKATNDLFIDLPEPDLSNYRKLKVLLNTPPEEGLSMNFSAKLLHRISKQLERKNKIKFYTGWALTFIITMPLLLFCLFILDQVYKTEIITSVLQYKWIFISVFPLLFIIQYLDYTTIKARQLGKMLAKNKIVQ